MRSEITSRRRSRGARAAVLLAVLLSGLGLLAGAASAQVQVTTLYGEASASGELLDLHATVVEGRPFEVAGGGRCTLLLARQTLVRVCGPAAATVVAAGGSRPGSIELHDGILAVVALPESQEQAFRIRTPETEIVLLGAGVNVEVEAGSGRTTVSALDSPARLVGRRGGAPLVLEAGQQLTIEGDGTRREPTPTSRLAVEHAGRCVHRPEDTRATLTADRALLVSGLPQVSAQAVDATPIPPVDHLLDIVRMDVPADGLPLQPPSPPSALVTELNKRGVDEEVCDPINCNPVFQVEPPGRCGVPPARGCIP